MTAPAAPPRTVENLADVVRRLGSIPLERIVAVPAPGTATEADVLLRPGGEKRLYELVDGVLVEKPFCYYESALAGLLIQALRNYLDQHDLGIVLAPDGTLRLAPRLVRLPDVSFILWNRFPNRELPPEPILDMAPDLAVEILSRGNTPQEMARKIREYFAAGTRLVWVVDPESRTVRVYTSPADAVLLTEADELDGDEVLPGFRLPIGRWFAQVGGRRKD